MRAAESKSGFLQRTHMPGLFLFLDLPLEAAGILIWLHAWRSPQQPVVIATGVHRSLSGFFSVNFEGLIQSLQLHTWRSCTCSSEPGVLQL